MKSGGYSLRDIGASDDIKKDIYYSKTFGGAPPSVAIDVIANRFIAFPETIKGSEDSSKIFYPMKAVTHIYDIQAKKIIVTSESYIYDHNVPLVYDVAALARRVK